MISAANRTFLLSPVGWIYFALGGFLLLVLVPALNLVAGAGSLLHIRRAQ